MLASPERLSKEAGHREELDVALFSPEKILQNLHRSIKSHHVILAAVLIGLLIRFSFFWYRSPDFRTFLEPWCEFIKAHGGFQALRYDFSNYSPPYLYFLALVTYIPIPYLYSIKIISLIFDFLLGFLVFRIVKLRYPDGLNPSLAFAAAFLAPTVMANSAGWAQCDSIYTSFLLATVLMAMLKKPVHAVLFFSIAISFKAQAVFLAPFLLILLLRGEIRVLHFLIVPVVYLLTVAPAAIAGRPWMDLLTIYTSQTENYGWLSHNCPNFYELFGELDYSTVGLTAFFAGILVVAGALIFNARKIPVLLGKLNNWQRAALLIVLLAPVLVLTRPFIDAVLLGTGSGSAYSAIKEIAHVDSVARIFYVSSTMLRLIVAGAALIIGIMAVLVTGMNWSRLDRREIIVKLALISVLLTPFLLPKMHDRYFYPADIISIIYAFYFPRFYYVPIVVISASLLSCIPFLTGMALIPMPYLSVAMALVLIRVICDFASRTSESVSPTGGASGRPRTSPIFVASR
jgi:Gpi18-like mannosyltransferase